MNRRVAMLPEVRDERSNAWARARAHKALQLFEQAQRALEDAAQMLSPIVGMSPEHDLVWKLRERVREQWYKLDARMKRKARRIGLDGVSLAAAMRAEK